MSEDITIRTAIIRAAVGELPQPWRTQLSVRLRRALAAESWQVRDAQLKAIEIEVLAIRERKAAATELLPLLEEEAKKRQVASLRQGYEIPVVTETLQRERKGRSITRAAEIVGVGQTNVQIAMARRAR